MRGFARLLFAMSQGCGKLPLAAAAMLLLAARLNPILFTDASARVRPEAPHTDIAIIDGVLSRRAPELGLTLRQQLSATIADEAERVGYDPLLVLAIIDVESDFLEEAVSNKGARGLMQIQPSTLYFLAQKQGLRLSREEVAADPALCVRLGIRYLRTLHDRFGDLDMALMAYNAGPGRIRAAIREGELDFFRGYPKLVRRDFRRFREGIGLEGDWALAQRGAVLGRSGGLGR